MSEDFNWQVEDLETWWRTRPMLRDVFSPDAIREAMLYLMSGDNYRAITERVVREKLHIYHSWLLQVAHRARSLWGSEWPARLLEQLNEAPDRSAAVKDLRVWVVGLTHKTAQNLGLSKRESQEFKSFLEEMWKLCNSTVESHEWGDGQVVVDLRNLDSGDRQELDLAETLWLLQMVGASTLTIRGSNKAIFGKRLERAFLGSALELLGFTKGENFWLNIGRDEEVDREADGEVETKRGRIRIDMGLIGVGNQEVSEDKLNRVGRNGIVIVDKLGRGSQVGAAAERLGVKLVQIRHNFVLTEIYHHLKPLVKIEIKEPPKTRAGLRARLAELPDEVFDVR